MLARSLIGTWWRIVLGACAGDTEEYAERMYTSYILPVLLLSIGLFALFEFFLHGRRIRSIPPRGTRGRLNAMVFIGAGLTALMVPPLTATAGDEFVSWRLEVGLSSLYDNNILRYSDKYLDRFSNRQDEGRFHINRADDLLLVSSIRCAATLKLIGTLKTTGAAEFRQRTYTHNGIKDWSYVSLSLRQDLARRTAAQIQYNYAPQFYVRHYRDDDWIREYGYQPITFQPFAYRKDEIGGWVQHLFSHGTRVRGLFSYTRYFHNEHFTEYDCLNRLVGVELSQTVHKNVRLNGGYRALVSRAKGNLADTDPSYNEDSYTLGAEVRLPGLFSRSNSVAIDGEYARRCYTTGHFLELDPLHAGRRDYDYRVSLKYDIRLLDNLGLAVAYAWHRRDARTSAGQNAEYLSAEKDYRQYQIGFEVNYVMNFVPSDEVDFERNR